MCDNFLYVFKGARSAPGRDCPLILEAPGDRSAERRMAERLHAAGWRDRGLWRAGAPAAFLWPLRATSAPARTTSPAAAARQLARYVSGGVRSCKSGHPSGARS